MLNRNTTPGVGRLVRRLPTVVTASAIIGLLYYGPVAQFADYHAFADQRTLFGIPRAGDVLSNIGFAIVGVWGLRQLWTSRRQTMRSPGRLGYGLFLIALIATAAGSVFYHLAPDNSRLVWDRLPIALACAGLLAAVRAETRDVVRPRAELIWFVVAAMFSVLWWQVTDRTGTGDLRPYLLLQAAPLVLIPLWQTLSGAPPGQRVAFGIAIGLYVAAKLAELNDRAIFESVGLMSGHTLKHLLATAASFLVARQAGFQGTSYGGAIAARRRSMA